MRSCYDAIKCFLSNFMIDFIKRNSHSVSLTAMFGSYFARQHQINFGAQRQI